MATGRNCRITASSLGSIYLRVEKLSYGTTVIATEVEAANVRVMNTQMRVSGPFTLGVVFVTYDEAQSFRRWLRRWAALAASTGTNPLRVEVPARNFDRIGIYRAGLTYGDAITAIDYRMSLTFGGTRDPLDAKDLINSSGDISSFVAAANVKGAPDAPFFYPWTSVSSTSDFSADAGLYGTPKAPSPSPLAQSANTTDVNGPTAPGF